MTHFHKDLDQDGSEVVDDSKKLKADYISSPDNHEQ